MNWNGVVLFFFFCLFQKYMKDELDKVLEMLGCFGVIRGKLSSEKENIVIYTVTIQADVDSVDVMRRLRQERLFV